MRKTYGLALVREYDVKPFAGIYDLETAERLCASLSRKTNATLVVINLESVNV